MRFVNLTEIPVKFHNPTNPDLHYTFEPEPLVASINQTRQPTDQMIFGKPVVHTQESIINLPDPHPQEEVGYIVTEEVYRCIYKPHLIALAPQHDNPRRDLVYMDNPVMNEYGQITGYTLMVHRNWSVQLGESA